MPLTDVRVPAAHGISLQEPSVHVVCWHCRFTHGPVLPEPPAPPTPVVVMMPVVELPEMVPPAPVGPLIVPVALELVVWPNVEGSLLLEQAPPSIATKPAKATNTPEIFRTFMVTSPAATGSSRDESGQFIGLHGRHLPEKGIFSSYAVGGMSSAL